MLGMLFHVSLAKQGIIWQACGDALREGHSYAKMGYVMWDNLSHNLSSMTYT